MRIMLYTGLGEKTGHSYGVCRDYGDLSLLCLCFTRWSHQTGNTVGSGEFAVVALGLSIAVKDIGAGLPANKYQP